MNDPETLDFVRQIIADDQANGTWGGQVITRFPPEPNGYLHIGHAKSICLNFGVAAEHGGMCRLRFDDTNPSREDQEYVDSIIQDVQWLGWQWEGEPRFASDYFEQMYQWAEQLVQQGQAYVCDCDKDTLRQLRGDVNRPGQACAHRKRSVDENLDLLRRMRAGEFPDHSRTLRAKIDMASANMNLRDPLMYRVLHEHHHRQGDDWCLYPMYDWAHGLEDSIEGVTHSICTLEFEHHRPLYDWFLAQLGVHHPQQIEFARLNLSHTVMSKRKFIQLVDDQHIAGWDDPRLPTIAGMRRRGYSPAGIRGFATAVGVTKFNSLTELSLLEYHIRQDLNATSNRVMAVLDPIKVVITNWPEGQVDQLEAINNPEDESAGPRQVPFTGELYIEREDFMEDAPKKFFRLTPGREVRLRYAYFITCTEVIKNEAGEITELHCSYDPDTRGGNAPDNRKVKATLHWVSAAHALDAEVRLYESLLQVPEVQSDNWLDDLNPNSLVTRQGCKVEPHLADAQALERWQFERIGYFCTDPDSQPDKLVFNSTVGLKDAWAKAKKKG